MIRRPPRSTRTDTLFPYTTLFRSYREAEADDQEVDLRAGGCERCDPAALAWSLKAEARPARARHPARFGERGDGIVGEQRKDLRIFVARCAGAALVIDEGADARGGKHTL